jgi:hypothetical protein
VQKQSSPPYEEWGICLKSAFGSGKKAHEAPKMVIMPVAENQGVKSCRIDFQNCQIVEQNLGRDTEIDEDVANFGLAPTLDVKRNAELSGKIFAWWLIS